VAELQQAFKTTGVLERCVKPHHLKINDRPLHVAVSDELLLQAATQGLLVHQVFCPFGQSGMQFKTFLCLPKASAQPHGSQLEKLLARLTPDAEPGDEFDLSTPHERL
jgi:hypothetical protein